MIKTNVKEQLKKVHKEQEYISTQIRLLNRFIDHLQSKYSSNEIFLKEFEEESK